MRLCSESRAAKVSLDLAGDFLGTGPLDFCRSQLRDLREMQLYDAVQRVRDLLAVAPPPRASSPVVEAGLLAVELVLDPLASEEARLGLHVWPGLSPTQARRKMMMLCHPDKLSGCAKAASAAAEISHLFETVQIELDDFRGAPLTLAETRLMEAVRRVECSAPPPAQARRKAKKRMCRSILSLEQVCSLRDRRGAGPPAEAWQSSLMRFGRPSLGQASSSAGSSTNEPAGFEAACVLGL